MEFLHWAIQSARAFFQSPSNQEALVHPTTRETEGVAIARSAPVQYSFPSFPNNTDSQDITNDEVTDYDTDDSEMSCAGSDYSIVCMSLSSRFES